MQYVQYSRKIVIEECMSGWQLFPSLCRPHPLCNLASIFSLYLCRLSKVRMFLSMTPPLPPPPPTHTHTHVNAHISAHLVPRAVRINWLSRSRFEEDSCSVAIYLCSKRDWLGASGAPLTITPCALRSLQAILASNTNK